MGLLPRDHRDPRDRAPKKVRRKSKKFIPDADSDFAYTGLAFARVIERDPARYHLTQEDASIISEAVQGFRSALSKALHRFSRTQQTIMVKQIARKKTEEVVRKYGRIIRANPAIAAQDKASLRISERKSKCKSQSCPKTPPHLRYVRGIDDGGPGSVRHVLQCKEHFTSTTNALPAGAERLELFVEWVPPGERIPKSPEEMYGRAWYVRSFTRSKFEVAFPMPPVPMMIVYWGRWSDSKGEVSRWSQTVVARVEGWSSKPEDVEVLTGVEGSAGALPNGLHGGKREIASDARFFLAERREVCERYLEGAGALPSAIPASMNEDAERDDGEPVRLLDAA